MHVDLSDEEIAVLMRELDTTIEGDRFPALAPHPDLEGDPRQAPAEAGPRALGAPKPYEPPRVGTRRRR
jgi:hypothetical protein